MTQSWVSSLSWSSRLCRSSGSRSNSLITQDAYFNPTVGRPVGGTVVGHSGMVCPEGRHPQTLRSDALILNEIIHHGHRPNQRQLPVGLIPASGIQWPVVGMAFDQDGVRDFLDGLGDRVEHKLILGL